MSTHHRSGLVVPMPDLEAVVGPHRHEWDPVAPLGAGAHVTVLFPFVPPADVDDASLRRVERALAGCAPFAVAFTTVERFPDDVLYLAPDPADAFRAVTARLHGEFPEHPPYHGQFDTVIPHLTVAHHPDAPLAEIEAALRGLLPLHTTADAVELWVEGDDDRWSTRARFPLSAARTRRRRPRGPTWSA